MTIDVPTTAQPFAAADAPTQSTRVVKKATTASLPFAVNAHRETEVLRITGMENPHFLVAGGSQSGKTTTMRLVAATAAALGIIVVVFDPKWRWKKYFGDVPHVLVYSDPEEWNEVIEKLYREMVRRYQLDERGEADLTDEGDFPTVLILGDEMASMYDESNDWWRQQIDPNDPDGKKQAKGNSPLHGVWQWFLYRGAESRMVLGAASHQASASIFPRGTGSRQLYGQRLALGVDVEPQSWTMLVGPGRTKPYVPHGQRGAGVYLQGTEHRRVQCICAPPREQLLKMAWKGVPILRAAGHLDPFDTPRLHTQEGVNLPRPGRVSGGPLVTAESGMAGLRTAQTPADVPGAGTSAPAEWPAPETPRLDPKDPHAADPASEEQQAPASAPAGAAPSGAASGRQLRVGLRAAVDYLNEYAGGYSTESFRRARQRRPIDDETTSGRDPAWSEHALRSWHNNRPRAGQRSKTKR